MSIALTPLVIAKKIGSAIASMVGTEYQSKSLIDASRAARVEPIVAIDATIQTQPYMTDVLHSLCSLVSAYYLQAAAIHTRIGDVSILQKLDRLNPERNLGAAVYGKLPGLADHETCLPSYNPKPTYNSSRPSLESAVDAAIEAMPALATNTTINQATIAPEEKRDATGSGNLADNRQTLNATINKIENLMVGKILEVEFLSPDGSTAATIPVTVKLIPVAVMPSIFAVAYSAAGLKNTTKQRWHRMRAGELSFIGDFIMGNDLIDAHRAALMKDKSGFYAAVSKRRNKNSATAMVSGEPSLADAANIVVLSKRTASQLETELMGRIDGIETRNQLFSVGSLMLLCVIDAEMETITVYHRGIDLPSKLNLRDLKMATKGQGVDIADVLKAYQLNQAPKMF